MKGERRTLRLSTIQIDDRAQPRTALLPDRVAEYVEDMGRGDKFPPLVVFQNSTGAWLADGFHRYHAAVGLEAKTIECEVHRGGLREAILYSCSANAAHGLRRTNEDKRQAVTKLLTDDEWSHWSDREIARQCRVGADLVGRIREKMRPVTIANDSETERTYRTKHGKTSTMRTGNVGRGKGKSEDEPQLDLPSRIIADNENGWISSALWEIERQIMLLPSPQETAERFPTHHHHTLTSAKLATMADWLTAFAVAWRKHVEEEDHGKEGSEAA